MHQEDFTALVDRISYKPGYTVDWGINGMDMVEITIGARVPDSIPGRQESTVLVRRSMVVEPPIIASMRYGDAVAFIRGLIWQLEDHEVDEWFRVDGELVRNPHE